MTLTHPAVAAKMAGHIRDHAHRRQRPPKSRRPQGRDTCKRTATATVRRASTPDREGRALASASISRT
eukprot:scaffold1438_cov51-Phaeocystis_antarctica.AAC.1